MHHEIWQRMHYGRRQEFGFAVSDDDVVPLREDQMRWLLWQAGYRRVE
jgi:hypothetical protein